MSSKSIKIVKINDGGSIKKKNKKQNIKSKKQNFDYLTSVIRKEREENNEEPNNSQEILKNLLNKTDAINQLISKKSKKKINMKLR